VIQVNATRYWKADPHQFGPGKVHVIHEDGQKVICGRPLKLIPGREIPAGACNCKGCLTVLDARERREEQRQKWEEEYRLHLATQAIAKQEWWDRYNEYLESPEWQERRAAVLARAKYVCEACGIERATEVHHPTYAHVFNEPLFELRAICHDCHETLTEQDREARRTI
jgi:hypothetical protein